MVFCAVSDRCPPDGMVFFSDNSVTGGLRIIPVQRDGPKMVLRAPKVCDLKKLRQAHPERPKPGVPGTRLALLSEERKHPHYPLVETRIVSELWRDLR